MSDAAERTGFFKRFAAGLEAFRDEVVRGSQVGKRRLDVTLLRRQMNSKLQDIGDGFNRLALAGKVSVPEELGPLIQEMRQLEERLREEEQKIAQL